MFFLKRVVGANDEFKVPANVGIYLQYLILLTGVFITSLLLWYEIDKNNPVLQKVCTGIVKGNCNAILTGKQSKLFGWLSWSEVGFFYFSGGLLVLLSAREASAGLVVTTWLNILALPYTVFSVYYQWRVAKQWCVLCMAVQALLILGGVNVFVSGYLQTPLIITVATITSIAIAYTLPLLVWYSTKPLILRLQESINTKREFLRIKFNTEIFETLLNKQKNMQRSFYTFSLLVYNNFIYCFRMIFFSRL